MYQNTTVDRNPGQPYYFVTAPFAVFKKQDVPATDFLILVYLHC